MNQKTDKKRGKPTSVDGHVGARLRQLRTLLGLSQEKLATGLGLTFQQIQKYERGANRIGASRLYDLSRLMDVPVSYFFEGLDVPEDSVANYGLAEEKVPDLEGDPLQKRETLELVRAYYRISDPSVRKKLLDLAKSMASTFGEDEDDS